MQLYLWWIIIGIILVIVEFLTPTLFFLNFGIACLITAVFAYLAFSPIVQALVFLVSTGLLLLFVKPILQKFYDKKSEIDDKYVGQKVVVTNTINEQGGKIKIYGEEWIAKPLNDGEIYEIGQEVQIVKRDSLIMYVEKI